MPERRPSVVEIDLIELKLFLVVAVELDDDDITILDPIVFDLSLHKNLIILFHCYCYDYQNSILSISNSYCSNSIVLIIIIDYPLFNVQFNYYYLQQVQQIQFYDYYPLVLLNFSNCWLLMVIVIVIGLDGLFPFSFGFIVIVVLIFVIVVFNINLMALVFYNNLYNI